MSQRKLTVIDGNKEDLTDQVFDAIISMDAEKLQSLDAQSLAIKAKTPTLRAISSEEI